MTNGIVPCVLGPTSFYFKIWVNILNIRMLLCSWWSLSGFIMIFIWFIIHECMMSFWVHHMHVRWIYGLCPSVVSFTRTSECCWTMPFQICLGMYAWERKVDMHLHVHALRDCVVHVLYQLPYVSNSYWMIQDLLFAFAFHFSPNVLFTVPSMCKAEQFSFCLTYDDLYDFHLM